MTRTALAATQLARYRTTPVLSTTGTLSLAHSLIELRVAELPAYVGKAADRLVGVTEAVEAELTARLDGKADLRLERSFDLLVDRLWLALRSRLEFWQLYTHEGAELFSEAQREQLGLDEARELAALAEQLLARLFGEGADFLRLSYPQQAAHMAARLRYIEERGHGPGFEQLVGARAAALVKLCQARYAAMVTERDARPTQVNVNLRLLRDQLRRAIERYANLVLSIAEDEEVDDSLAQAALDSLHPMLAARERLSRGDAAQSVEPGGSEGEAAEDQDQLDEPAASEALDEFPPKPSA